MAIVIAGGTAIPDPALVVLIGPSGAGKSTWAAARYRSVEIVSSDALRAVVGSGEHDLDASADALSLLDTIVRARLGRGLTCVVDTLGLDAERRRRHLAAARDLGRTAVAIVFGTAAAECRRRNRSRDRTVPAAVLDRQIRRMRDVTGEVAVEPWDLVVRVDGSGDPPVDAADPPVRGVETPASGVIGAPASPADGPRFRLQVSRFGWGEDRLGWLSAVAEAARTAGFEGLALMDHLIQIPQVGRAWDPIPDPWVTLGALAPLAPDLLLGTLVSPLSLRSAGLLAKAAATLSALSGGRAFCGVGAGWWEREHAAFGRPFASTTQRLDDLETGIEVLRALWAPGTKAYRSDRVSLPETTNYPRPVGRIPIIVGGAGERRTLSIAARLGDACNIPSALDLVERKIRVLHEHCRAARRDPREVAVTVLDVPVIGASREDLAARIERLRGRTSAAVFAARHHAGLARDHAHRYRTLGALGVQTIFVALPDLGGPQEVLDFAPIIASVRAGG